MGGTFFATFQYDVCCVLHSCLSSHVSPARLWPRPWNKTPPWWTCFWAITTSALKGRRLGVRWGWGHEGRGSEEIQRKDQDTAVWKWSQENTEKHCRAALILRFATFVIEFNLNNRLADSFVFAACNFVFRDGKNYGSDFFRSFAISVYCVLHRFSQVMCLLPGSGWRPQRELHPDKPVFGWKQHRSRRGQGLVFRLFGEDGVMRGVGVKKGKGRIKTRPCESEVRKILRSTAGQRWFSDLPRLWSNST